MPNPNVISVFDEPSIIRSTALRLSEGLRPRRVVLRHLWAEMKYVVHDEYLKIRVETRQSWRGPLDYVICTHDGFDHGSYFEYGPGWGRTREAALALASSAFDSRAARY